MSSVIVNLSGLKAVQSNLENRVDALVRTLAFTCEAEVVDNFSSESPSAPGDAPGIDTGNLKNNIMTQPEDGGYVVYSYPDYSAPLEYGTIKMAARPFMLPAFERTVARIAPKQLREIVE